MDDNGNQNQKKEIPFYQSFDLPTLELAKPPPDPALIVLQWLTYAFWGWMVFSLSILTGLVMANFVSGADVGEFTPYAIAAVLVLLPISIASDVYYSRQEPNKKIGTSSTIMIVHAVIFAIFGIGALISIVYCLVQMLISSTGSANIRAALYSSIIIAVLYAAIFFRTLYPARFKIYRKPFRQFMAGSVIIITILGIVGPINHAHATRNDRLIEDNLYNVQTGVDDYVTAHHQLPDRLNKLNLSGDPKKLADGKLIRYKANTKPAIITEDTFKSATHRTDGTIPANLPKTYYYTLCVTYKRTGGGGFNSSYSGGQVDSDGYDSYVSTTDHPAGIFCYKVSSTPIY